MNSRVVIAGGSGFIGQSLAKALLSKKHEVVILTRSPSHQSGGARFLNWDGKTVGDWAHSLDGAATLQLPAQRTRLPAQRGARALHGRSQDRAVASEDEAQPNTTLPAGERDFRTVPVGEDAEQ